MKLFLKCCNLCLFRFSKCTLSLKTYCCLMPNIISCQTRIKPFQPMCMQARINAAAAGAGTKLTLLKIFCVRTLTLKSAYDYELFSIFNLPFANSDKNKADLAGQTFHRNRKKKIPARSSAALDLTVCKKRCVQKTST